MKTDKIFHKLFSYYPQFFFELLDKPEIADLYEGYSSKEVKEKAFRLDGVLAPKQIPPALFLPLIFAEIQMQLDPDFYRRLWAEIFLYLSEYKYTERWKAVVIFKDKQAEPKRDTAYQALFEAGLIEVIYLKTFLKNIQRDSLGLNILRLIVAPTKQAIPLAQQLMNETHLTPTFSTEQNLTELIETIVLQKFPKLNRTEVQNMLDLGFDVKKTVFYQEAKEEGIAEGIEQGIEKGLEQGIEKGIEKGREEERLQSAKFLLELIEKRLGSLEEAQKEQVLKASSEILKTYYEKLFTATHVEALGL